MMTFRCRRGGPSLDTLRTKSVLSHHEGRVIIGLTTVLVVLGITGPLGGLEIIPRLPHYIDHDSLRAGPNNTPTFVSNTPSRIVTTSPWVRCSRIWHGFIRWADLSQ